MFSFLSTIIFLGTIESLTLSNRDFERDALKKKLYIYDIDPRGYIWDKFIKNRSMLSLNKNYYYVVRNAGSKNTLELTTFLMNLSINK